MNRKYPNTIQVAICVALLLLVAPLLQAQLIRFRLNRFGGICLQTAKGKEHVKVYQGNKQGEEVLFASRLEPVSGGTYTAPGGICFTLKHLANAVVNDANRHLDSGNWQLTVSGRGDQFERLKDNMPFVAIGNLPPLTYLGEVDQ